MVEAKIVTRTLLHECDALKRSISLFKPVLAYANVITPPAVLPSGRKQTALLTQMARLGSSGAGHSEVGNINQVMTYPFAQRLTTVLPLPTQLTTALSFVQDMKNYIPLSTTTDESSALPLTAKCDNCMSTLKSKAWQLFYRFPTNLTIALLEA